MALAPSRRLVRRAVQVDQRLVDQALLAGLEAEQLRADRRRATASTALLHAFAAVAARRRRAARPPRMRRSTRRSAPPRGRPCRRRAATSTSTVGLPRESRILAGADRPRCWPRGPDSTGRMARGRYLAADSGRPGAASRSFRKRTLAATWAPPFRRGLPVQVGWPQCRGATPHRVGADAATDGTAAPSAVRLEGQTQRRGHRAVDVESQVDATFPPTRANEEPPPTARPADRPNPGAVDIAGAVDLHVPPDEPANRGAHTDRDPSTAVGASGRVPGRAA